MKRSIISSEVYMSFIHENKEILYRIAYGYLQDHTKSMDALDEATYLGYSHLYQLKEPSYLKTWLVRILMNECYKILRKNKREITTEYIPENSYEFETDKIYLKHAIKKLPEDLRKIIILRYFGGYTIEETGQILGIPEGTVSTRCKKGLSLLRVEISE